MQKAAQKRSVLNKLREKTNISGIAAEKFFNPEFERVMNSLRSADNKVRAIASGKEIEGEDYGQDNTSLKDLVKSAKSYLNRREYMTAIAFLSRFHKKIEEITKVFKTLDLDVDKIHHDFLFKNLDEEQKQYLHDLKSRFAAENAANLVSQASIMDFLINVGTERGRALAAWEKRYPKQIGKLRKDLSTLVEKSESMLRLLLSSFKEMATYRATRKIDDYMKVASKIEGQYHNYEKIFRDFYNSDVKGFLEKQELIAPTKTLEDNKDLGKQEVAKPTPVPDLETPSAPVSNIPLPLVEKPTSFAPAAPISPAVPAAPVELKPGELPPSGSPALSAPKLPTNLGPSIPSRDTELGIPEEEVDTDRSPEMPPPSSSKSAHLKFIKSLETLSGESPLFLASHIKRYARSLPSKDKYIAQQLLHIAQSIGE